MSAQRETSAVQQSHRSIVPSIPGVPWWAAVLVAVGATAIGYLIDSGHKELTHVFAGFYIAGCVAAVLAVRQAAVFTAVIQPPLILFCAVPGAYWLFHGGKVDKFKDLLINCGYPLIERFPLMLGTAGGVLLIGLLRWYLGKHTAADATDAGTEDTAGVDRPSVFGGLLAKLSSLVAGVSTDEVDAEPAHSRARTARTNRTSRNGSRPAQRPTRTRSRHARPDDGYEPDDERPRRSTRRSSLTDPADLDPGEAPRRSRRRRPDGDDLGAPPPREARREPRPRRNPYERTSERSYERPEPRSSRFDPYETYDRPEPARGERRSRHERRGGYEPYSPYDSPYEPRSRRAASAGATGSGSTHHPISQVRYRGQAARSEREDESRPERRNGSRAPRRRSPDPWDYEL